MKRNQAVGALPFEVQSNGSATIKRIFAKHVSGFDLTRKADVLDGSLSL